VGVTQKDLISASRACFEEEIMGYNQNNYDDGEEEAAEAQNRIDQILGGGGAGQQSPQQQPQQDASYTDDPLGGPPRVELRSRAARSALGYDQPQAAQGRQRPRQSGPAPRAQQAILVVGGILALGVVVVVVIVLLASALKPGAAPIALPFVSTATPTPTETPTPTVTPTPEPTIPPLQLPNLTCLVQSQTGCLDYCQNTDNLTECAQAKAVVENEGGDFTAFLKCLEPVTGANTGNPQTCLENAYRIKQGLPTPAN
jgi:hypothetical protein